MLQKIIKWLFSFLIVSTFFFIGFTYGKYKSISPYYFKKDLDPIGIATIITNVILASYLSIIIGKSQEINKKDKEIILNRLDKAISDFEDFSTKLHINTFAVVDVISLINRKILSIENLCKNFKEYHQLDDKNIKDGIISQMKELNRLMTYTPPNNKVDKQNPTPIKIENGIISYGSNRIDEITNKIEDIINGIVKLQLFINSK